jgi:hypothetical protein
MRIATEINSQIVGIVYIELYLTIYLIKFFKIIICFIMI